MPAELMLSFSFHLFNYLLKFVLLADICFAVPKVFLQSLAFLEVLHGAIGIVPSGVLLPLMQWGGRTHFLLAIVRSITEVQELPAVFITFSAWSISEVIRYSHYALNCISSAPHWVTYLKYTAFIVQPCPSSSIHTAAMSLFIHSYCIKTLR
ncbi:PREDICTED: very-long-chain (3R)-3-hydroxyacyl-CoA dehydratase 2-like [Ipomoea nil]|uniref:very-long-chain (3R)-3-hydroxyacyl-CoA dehydratase 2-like n=1 Tax=Ipomoea nil TaxID=35883 RepID=UPI000900E20E|nr:PREDICTED: very-long-chain (3R)-3-hydroxyacyl-CoA dehydratase 2-like [Ipomoea nil]